MKPWAQEDSATFLNLQGWPFKRAGEELIASCPFCEEPDRRPEHFYMQSRTGVWNCKKCGESGNLYQLRKRLNLTSGNCSIQGIRSLGDAISGNRQAKRIPASQIDSMHAALLQDPESLDYCLQTRFWSLDVLKKLKIGLRQDGRGKWFSYPYWRKGVVVGLKYRILPAYADGCRNRFEREPGCESILFNIDALNSPDEIILCSGESDAIALLSLGFENVVGSPTGESSLPPTAVDALMSKARVFVPYDNDSAGQKGVREIAKRIGFERTYLVRLPQSINDVNEFVINGGTRQEFEALIFAAQQLDVPSISNVFQALDQLEDQKNSCNWDQIAEVTAWSSINRLVGRWDPGNLIVVSGPQGTGKTTWVLNVVSSWAAKAYPALFYCLEMSTAELVQHVLCAHYRLPEEQITSSIISRARQDLSEWLLYLGANLRLTGIKEVSGLLRLAARRYGIRLLVFDNLHLLARSIDHRSEEVGIITKSFKLLAMELEIPIVLIAQPRKLEPGKVMTPYDLKDSVDIFSDADQIIILHREHLGASSDSKAIISARQNSEDNLDSKTLIRLAKARHRPSKDSVLYFIGGEHRFCEIYESPDSRGLPASNGESKSICRKPEQIGLSDKLEDI
jgi:hypothetical protein